MSDIIDINVAQTVEEVTINVVDNVIQVNINQVNGGGGIESVVAGANISVNNTDPNNPIVSATGLVPYNGATSDVNLGEFGVLTGNLEFDNTPTNIPTSAGSAYWNDSDGTLDLILKGGNVKLQVGQEQVIRVVNKTVTNINLLEANYQAVRVTGAQGQRLKVDLAQATTDNLSAETIGLVTETINNNQEGFITTSGLVRNINTTGSLQGETWEDGDILYLSPTVAGRITKVKPSAPNHLVVVGYVIHAHATQGSIFVKVDNGYELDELHNVKISTPLDNEGLIYNSTLEVWENKKIDLQRVLTEGNIATLPIDVGNIIASDVNGGESPLQLITSFVDSSPIALFDTVTGNTATINLSSVLYNSSFYIPRILNGDFLMTELQTTNFTAVNSVTYIANGTLTVTDSTPLANKGFIVHVIGGTVTIGGVAYTSGALVYRYYDGSSWISTNMNSAITIDATPTDGSSNAVSSNGVFDALETKVTFWGSGADGTSVANTLTITPTYSQLIPANTFSAGDVLDLECRLTSPGAKTSVSNLYFYVNTSNSVSGATQLAIYTSGATNRTIQNQRKLSIKGATTKSINPAILTSNTDLGAFAALTTHTIDWTVDQYIIFAIGHTVADQTMFGDFYKIQKT